MSLIAGVLAFSGGSVAVATDAPDAFNGGTPVLNDGSLCINGEATQQPNPVGGQYYDAEGRLGVDPLGAVATYSGGLPLTTQGNVAVAYDTPSNWVAGIPLTLGGRMAISPNWSLDATAEQIRDAIRDISKYASGGFLLPGNASPRINASARASVAMERQSDGTYRFAPCNRLFPSNDYSAWTKNDCVISAGATAPNGGASSRLTANAGTHAARAYAGGSLTLGEVVTWYCVARYVNNQWLWLRGEPTGASEMAAAFDIQNGVVGGRSGDLTNHGIASIGGGWYLCWITQTMFATGVGNMVIRCGNSTTPTNANIAYAGTEAVDLWHSGLCSGTGQPTIVPTTTTAIYAPAIAHDGTAWGVQSEAAATNLALWNAAIGGTNWSYAAGYDPTLNAAVAPDGTTTATSINISAASGNLRQSVTVTASTQYTFSFFAKRGSGAECRYSVYNSSGSADIVAATSYYSSINASTWTRVDVTFTTPAGCTSILIYPMRDVGANYGTTLLWGAQLETGPRATSPILTYGATATRAADLLLVPDTVSGLVGQFSGTIAVEASVDPIGATGVVSINDGSDVDEVSLRANAVALVRLGSSDIMSPTIAAQTAGVRTKSAMSYALRSAGASRAGSAAVRAGDSSPGFTQVQLGGLSGGTSANGNTLIRRIRISKNLLSNNQDQILAALQSLTT
jgi:hypothetical protein